MMPWSRISNDFRGRLTALSCQEQYTNVERNGWEEFEQLGSCSSALIKGRPIEHDSETNK